MHKSIALKKNDILTLTAESTMQNGNAISHTEDGFVVFIISAAAGDVVSARIIKVTKNYAVAKIEKILQPSSSRYEDGCPFGQKCGGCVFQHITYNAESDFKKGAVNDVFERIAKSSLRLEEYIPCQTIEGYRNKAVYPVGQDASGKLISGFYAPMSHNIVVHDTCLIGNPVFPKIRDAVLSFLQDNNIRAYDEKTLSGLIRSIYIRSSATNEICLTLILNGKQLKDSLTENAFCSFIQELFPEIVTVLINQNTSNGNAVLGKNWRTLCGDGYIYDELCSKKFRVYPASFWQVNNTQAQVLYNKAKEYADLKQGERLLDLYCGTGSVGICIAQKGTKLTGVEVVEQAVKDADFNAKLNNLDAEFICLETENALDDPRLKGLKPDVITVDPPRKGCVGAVEKIASLGAGKIVYISCDPATLARDIELFEKCGYAPSRACAVDMFPRTAHVECVVLLEKQIQED